MFKKHEFEVEEFYILGEWLSTQNPDIKNRSNIKEGIYRTIISRYYYYIFLKIRNILLTYDESNVDSFNSGGAHSLIVSYINALDDILGLDGDLEDIGNSLDALRKLRNSADYNTNKNITLDDVNRAKKWADKIKYSLQNIEFDNNIGFENILEYIRINYRDSHNVRFPRLKKDNKGRYSFE